MRITDEQAKAIERYLHARYVFRRHDVSIAMVQRDQAWGHCRAVGVTFMANGSVMVEVPR